MTKDHSNDSMQKPELTYKEKDISCCLAAEVHLSTAEAICHCTVHLLPVCFKSIRVCCFAPALRVDDSHAACLPLPTSCLHDVRNTSNLPEQGGGGGGVGVTYT